MAETLGSLCDKLTVIKLKQWHSEKQDKLKSLKAQEKQLLLEINSFIKAAVTGEIPTDRLTFPSNKVYKIKEDLAAEVEGTIGAIFSKLVAVNCQLWHEQEKTYDFENVPAQEKDKVVKRLALLNLERNQCIDNIDKQFRAAIEQVR
jgi:ribosomal protein L44E